MNERAKLLESIVATTIDYRLGELALPIPDHVDRWVKQFDAVVQIPMLREMDHVLKHTYFSKAQVEAFLCPLVRNKALAGSDPCVFWRKMNFLRIQKNGHSQRFMLALFDSILYSRCGVVTRECGTSDGNFVYIDDAIFSGSRVGNDLTAWIEREAPAHAVLHVIAFAIHTLGEWLVGEKLKKSIASSSKKIEIKYWCAETIENRKAYRRNAEILWPSMLPDEPAVQEYLARAHKFPFESRPTGGNLGPFSSEEGRSLLERELLLAGLRIRSACAKPKDIMRPLGFSPFSLGFGSLIVTYRNCPNNCPLPIWWGDPSASVGSPLRTWYPLFARKTYPSGIQYDSIGVVADERHAEFGFDDE